MAKKIKITSLSRERFADYLRKAEQFYSVMQICALDKEWDATVLNGVHSAISITDALLVYKAGIHSISAKHDDSVILLRRHLEPGVLGGQDNRLARILNFKHLVSYLPDRVTEGKGLNFVKDVERYFEWAKRVLV